MKKWTQATLITVGIIGASTVYYQGYQAVKEVVTSTVEKIDHKDKMQQAQLQQLAHLVKQMAEQGKTSQDALESLANVERHSIYTVTNERDLDSGWIKTHNELSGDVYISDIELDLFDLKEGDQVRMVLNEYGELISVEKIK